MLRGVKAGRVWSWIRIKQTVRLFSARGKAHPDEGEIYFELYQLISKMKNLGYIPDVKCVRQHIDYVEKEKMLLAHTEKLAITYGLLKTISNVLVRVIKNMRVCSDCHTTAKYIYLIRAAKSSLKMGFGSTTSEKGIVPATTSGNRRLEGFIGFFSIVPTARW